MNHARFVRFVRYVRSIHWIDRSIERIERIKGFPRATDVYACATDVDGALFHRRRARSPASLDAAMRVARLDAVARRGDASSARRARSRRARATASTRRRATAARRDDDDDDDARAATTLLDELARARDAGDGAFDDLVRARRDGLTVTFFDVAEARVRALERGGGRPRRGRWTRRARRRRRAPSTRWMRSSRTPRSRFRERCWMKRRRRLG